MKGLNTRRWARASRVLPPLLLLLIATPAAASDVSLFSGSVMDAVGNILEDVEVLAVTMSHGAAPAAAARSDGSGEFRFEALAPGIYRIVALKRGYLTFVGSVNTQSQNWLAVILQPAPPPGSPSSSIVPSDSAWALRLPRRSILRDVDDKLRADEEGSSFEKSASGGLLDDGLHMRIDQIFSAGADLWNDEDEPRMRGMETRFTLASAIGERGRFEFAGSRASCDAALTVDDPTSSTDSAAAALSAGFSYDTGLDSRLAVQTFFSDQELRHGAGAGEAVLQPVRRNLRSWGYDAGWSKQLDPLSSLELQLDYQDRSLRMVDGDQSLSDRAIGAAVSYVTLPAADHQVEVGFRAQFMDSPVSAPLVHGGELNRPRLGVDGYSIDLDAQDTWFVSGPFALLYGIGYKHALTSRDTALIAPRIGGSWTVDRLIMRFQLSYHAVSSWGEGELSDSDRPFRPNGSVGYEAQVELPLLAGFRLTGASSYSPIDMTFPTYPRGGIESSSQPLYFTDGNASVEERMLALVRERAGSRIELELGSGRVEGSLAPIFAYELPFFLLSDRHLRYRTGKLGIQIPSSGTDLRLDWRKIMATAPEPGAPGSESIQRSLEIHLAQELVRLRTMGSWRFLMALRRAKLEAADDESLLIAGHPSRQAPSRHQVSAGLSVLF